MVGIVNDPCYLLLLPSNMLGNNLWPSDSVTNADAETIVELPEVDNHLNLLVAKWIWDKYLVLLCNIGTLHH